MGSHSSLLLWKNLSKNRTNATNKYISCHETKLLAWKRKQSGNRRGLWLRNHRWKANMSSESYRCQVTNEKPVYKTSICSFRMQCSSDLKTVRIFLEEQEKGECYFMAALGTTSEKHGWNCVGRCWNTNLQLHSSPSYSFLTLTPH